MFYRLPVSVVRPDSVWIVVPGLTVHFLTLFSRDYEPLVHGSRPDCFSLHLLAGRLGILNMFLSVSESIPDFSKVVHLERPIDPVPHP